MTAALQTEHAPNRRLDPDVARAEAEGMVTETAKVSATLPKPPREVPPAPPAANDATRLDDREETSAGGWSFHAASLARPRAQRWQPTSVVVATAVVAVVAVALMLVLV